MTSKAIARFTADYIEERYAFIEKYWRQHLYDHRVKMVQLYRNKKTKQFTRDALILVLLAEGYPDTRIYKKSELTEFLRLYFPVVNDVQQARHLGAQQGWWIVAGGRDNIVQKLNRDEYKLHSLEKPYPNYKNHRDIENIDDFEELKLAYRNRCACCGSEENKPHLHWPERKTILQAGHMDPNKPIEKGNIIPQCDPCNRGDRNRWVYDNKGRVIRIAGPSALEGCDDSTLKALQIYIEHKLANV